MALKSFDDILSPDPRSLGFVVVDAGTIEPIALSDHHSAIESICLTIPCPAEVITAFDRARNTMIYTFFEYELWVVGELQAFGALELALKPRLATIGVPTSGTMRTRIDRARKHGLMPPAKPGGSPWDSGEALIQMRNELSHGSFDVHTPAMALTVLRSCADQISSLYG